MFLILLFSCILSLCRRLVSIFFNTLSRYVILSPRQFAASIVGLVLRGWHKRRYWIGRPGWFFMWRQLQRQNGLPLSLEWCRRRKARAYVCQGWCKGACMWELVLCVGGCMCCSCCPLPSQQFWKDFWKPLCLPVGMHFLAPCLRNL